MSKWIIILFFLLGEISFAYAQARQDRDIWQKRNIPLRSKGVPEISPWHAGTAGTTGELNMEWSLFSPSRLGILENTELIFRLAEMPVLPNMGVKQYWLGNNRLKFSTEHTLYYTWPLLKFLQSTGFKDLIADSLSINQGLAMRHELLLSLLIHPREVGCPILRPEKVLTLRLGTEFYLGIGNTGVKSFDWFHTLYHTQIFEDKMLYYGGLQFDSYFSGRLHYSVNALCYNVDFGSDYAVESNLRFTYYVSSKIGLSASCKASYMDMKPYDTKLSILPLLDITYRITSNRGEIQHGLFKNRRKRR